MDFFTKRRAVIWTIVLLVVLNVCALGTVWYQQLGEHRVGPPPRREGRSMDVARFLERELGMNEQQAQEVKTLQRQFFSRAATLQREIGALRKENLEELLASAPDTRKADELALEIGKKETERERLLFTHFQAVKEVCTPSQKKNFDSLIHELLGLHGPAGHHGPPGPMPRRGLEQPNLGIARGEERHFRRLDADGNGAISQDEWRNHHRDVFRREIDTDGDGYAIASELRQHHEERRRRRGENGPGGY